MLRSSPFLLLAFLLPLLTTGSYAQEPLIEEWPMLPPRVIACSPKPFATNVPVDLKEISVTFDRRMDTETGAKLRPLRFAGAIPRRKLNFDPAG